MRSRALGIPEIRVRELALQALDCKRGNTHGAALFSVIPTKRHRSLLRLLTTYQVLWDFLDSLTETFRGLTPDDALQLHLALVDAVDPAGPIRDYYAALHISDGGYLQLLVETCRACCRGLPSFHKVAPVLRREARRIGVQAVNHISDPARRARTLRYWVAREYPGPGEVEWFELAAAAGANLAIYALLALAAERDCPRERVEKAYHAYFPWTGALATMLDGFVDQCDDARDGEHCYLAYYESTAEATRQVARLVHRCLSETHSLDDSERHTLVAAAMVAMYLSHESTSTPLLREASREIARAGGSLTHLLLPVLRVWRIASHSRAF